MGESKREAIPKGIRFEVFKRDKFTCQYCGQEAPDVILEVDHIVPVAEGGDNSLMNLITSCRDCNRGKGKKILSDDSVIKKQKAALDELQDRKEMIEMMAAWKKELFEEEDYAINVINEYLGRISEWIMSDTAKKDVRRMLRRYGFAEVYESFQIAYEKYFFGDDDSWNYAFRKVGGILYNRSIGRGADYYAE